MNNEKIMKNIVLGILLVSAVSISCKKDEKPTYLKDDTTANTNAAVQPTNTSATPSMASNTPVTSGSGLNPEHGKPGHRCDIPVGQPLNSTPQASAQPSPVNNVPNAVQINPNSPQVQNFQVPSKNAAPVKTAPGMNPPHGEPGHRCDIAVGQPLNSKPTAQTTPTPAPQPATTPAPQPVNNPQKAIASGVKPKTNPAHGEPWHDCALKVGDPLP